MIRPLKATRLAFVLPLWFSAAPAQQWDLGGRAATAVAHDTKGELKLSFEQRGRYEVRTGNAFGRDADVATGLFRTRLGLTYTPAKWIKFSGMAQDSRAPWYGAGAPNSTRDQADLHEGYLELFPSYKRGFGMTVGRMMLTYGEGRLIGTPQWGNLSRTFDHARLFWRLPKAQFEALLVSLVKIRIGEFNRPALGDRVWGTYNVFPDFYKKNLLEAYILRREQNRPGGFTGGSKNDGTDKVGINTLGFRLTGPLGWGVRYSLEAALQRGKTGTAELRAAAWFAGLSHRWTMAGKPLDVSAEYKYASGSANPADPNRSGTFDQLYAANHDKFGHQDLFGWRNIHNARSLTTLGLTKSITVNFMYDNYWLANRQDAVYNGGGRLIARSTSGTAGRHVGQETDLFGVYKYKRFTFGGGYGHFFSGEFIRKTTPGMGTSYLYLFHGYSL